MIVEIVVVGGNDTRTFLDIERSNGYKAGCLLSAKHVIDVIWSNKLLVLSYEKTICRIWLQSKVFGSQDPDVMLFCPLESETFVFVSKRLKKTSGLDPKLLQLMV